MSFFNCNSKNNCTFAAVIVSVIIGIITAFLQITGVITVTPVFLWVTFGIAVVYLAVLLATVSLAQGSGASACIGTALNALLLGILGTVLFSIVLLAVGIVATSAISAILGGLLLLFFSLTITSSACYVKCFADFVG